MICRLRRRPLHLSRPQLNSSWRTARPPNHHLEKRPKTRPVAKSNNCRGKSKTRLGPQQTSCSGARSSSLTRSRSQMCSAPAPSTINRQSLSKRTRPPTLRPTPTQSSKHQPSVASKVASPMSGSNGYIFHNARGT